MTWRWFWIGAVVLGFGMIALGLSPVFAQTVPDHMQMYHADPHYDQWFRSLKQPGSQISCCSLNDCDQTVAELRDGAWWAQVRGIWRQIPPEKIVKTPLSIDGEAYVCANPSMRPDLTNIYCFVPPIPGY